MEKAIFCVFPPVHFRMESMHDIHLYFIFFPLERIYWAAIGTLFHTMLNMFNLFFNKESSSEDRSDSGFDTYTAPQGDDGFFLEFSINFYSGNKVIF